MSSHYIHSSSIWLQRILSGFFLALALLFLPHQPLEALDVGTITSLSSSYNNNDVTVSTTLHANVALLGGSLYMEIRTPSGVVVGTKTVSTPTLLLGQNWSNNSTITVSGWTENGNYSVTACWTIGLVLDCALTTKTTTFFHVPGLGTELIILSGVLLTALFWHAHKNLAMAQAVES